MTINQHVQYARDYFGMPNIPGNIFEFITSKKNYIDVYNLVIFKEDLDKLSGFIGYEKSYAYICVNYQRSIGHQNLTLGHELGHYFIHRGELFSDKEVTTNCKSPIQEKEAFEFAIELLCPHKEFRDDIYNSTLMDDLSSKKFLSIGSVINDICHKYFLSFEVILRKILYEFQIPQKFDFYLNNIKDAIGGSLTYYHKDFYSPKCGIYSTPYRYPYDYLKSNVITAMNNGSIGKATGESILFTYGLLGDEEN